MPPHSLSAADIAVRLWRHATAGGVAPSPTTVLITGAAVVLVIAWRGSWQVLRYAVTACHEAGHAVVARLTGRRLEGVRLERRSAGVTLTRGRPRGPGLVATFLAGYLAPSVAGLAAVLLVRVGRPGLVLLLALVSVLALAMVVRNVLGWVVVLALVGVLAAGLWEPRVIAVVAPGIALFLLLAAVRDVIGLTRARRRDRATDADQLARITWLPAAGWVAVFLVLTCGAAVVGLWLLLTV